MWLVQLQYTSPDGLRTRTMCGCDTETGAHAAGKQLAQFYNHNPYLFQSPDAFAGIMIDTLAPLEYSYAIKEHKGEWI